MTKSIWIVPVMLVLTISANAAGTASSKNSPVKKMMEKRIYFSSERGVALASLKADNHWTCTMSLFFSMDQREQYSATPEADGRGLVTCGNREGFQTEYPMLAELKLEKTGELTEMLKRNSSRSELTVSMISGPFSITRELTDIQDNFLPKVLTSQVQNELLMIGQHSQVAFNLSATSRNRPISAINIKKMNLHFDSEAPEIY